MNLQEHLIQLQQEQENGVILSDKDVQEREKAILYAAKMGYGAIVAVFSALIPAVNKIKNTMAQARATFTQCNDVLATLHQKDVTQE